jgi:hypothetical protein
MLSFPGIYPVDYLLIGHITQDITPEGTHPGGAVAFAGLTAYTLGLQVGIVTSWGEESDPEIFKNLKIANHRCDHSTTFENIYSPSGRAQKIHHLAPKIDFYHVPEPWRETRIVHLAPVAQEIPPNIVRSFPHSDIYLSLQGWLREWDQQGCVTSHEWPEAGYILQQVKAAALSEEDVQYNEEMIYQMAASVPILAVTKGAQGADIYAEGKITSIPAPAIEEVDSTGAGDIFAAIFFSQLTHIGDPIRAAELAVQVASDSVKRTGLDGAPTEEILYQLAKEVQETWH